MARLNWFQRLYWRYLAKPAGNRTLYDYAIHHPVGSILEIGMGDGSRIRAILGLIQLPAEVKQLRYAAVDPFESAGKGADNLSLKAAHRMLTEFGVKSHLIPGDPSSAVARVAHTILPSDLVIIDGHWENGTLDSEAIAKWLPRLSHAKSTIFASNKTGGAMLARPLPSTADQSSSVSRAA